MEPFSWKRWPDALRDKWRHDLRDTDIWLNGYRKAVRNIRFTSMISTGVWIDGRCAGLCWIGGGSFTRAISAIVLEEQNGHYEHVIKVDLKPTLTAEEALGTGITSIQYQLTLAAAKELGV
ncbi:unnamed protein product [Alopecurus aequalis]